MSSSASVEMIRSTRAPSMRDTSGPVNTVCAEAHADNSTDRTAAPMELGAGTFIGANLRRASWLGWTDSEWHMDAAGASSGRGWGKAPSD